MSATRPDGSLVVEAGAGAGAVVLSKASMSSSNCHPVSVSINSESRSPEKALHKLTHSASTRKQTAIPGGDDRLPDTRSALLKEEERLLGCVIWRQFVVDI
jgi:hypothetical protein